MRALLNNVFLKSLRDQRRSLLGWGLGLVAVNAVIMAFYPSIAGATEFDELFKQMPEALANLFLGQVSDLTSPEGYLNSQLFVLFLPLLFIIFTVAWGSGAIAGEEDRGTIELILSYPLMRWRLVAEKFAAMFVAVLVLSVVSWLSLVIGAIAVDMDIGLGRLAEVTLSVTLLGVAFGTFALALGSATGKRGVSIGLASATGVIAYLWNGLAPVIDILEPTTKLSPFYYYIGADPLSNGLDFVHVVVLIGLITALLAVAVVTFQRRDLQI